MSLFCVVAGLLGHAAALEPMGVSDILGGVPSVDANVAGSSGARDLRTLPEVVALMANAPHHQSEAFWRCAARTPDEVNQMQACLQEAFATDDEKLKVHLHEATHAVRHAGAEASLESSATAPESAAPAKAVNLDDLQSRMGRLDGLLGRIHAPPKPEATPEAAMAETADAPRADDLPTATTLVANQAGLLTGLLPVHDAEPPLVEAAAAAPTSVVGQILAPATASSLAATIHSVEEMTSSAALPAAQKVAAGPDESYASSAAQAAVDTVSLADRDVGPLPVPSFQHLGTNTTRGRWLPDESNEASGYGTNTSSGRWVPAEAFQEANSVAEANALAETASADAQAADAKAQAAQAEAEAVVAEAAVRAARAEQQAKLNAQALGEAEAALKLAEVQSKKRLAEVTPNPNPNPSPNPSPNPNPNPYPNPNPNQADAQLKKREEQLDKQQSRLATVELASAQLVKHLHAEAELKTRSETELKKRHARYCASP